MSSEVLESPNNIESQTAQDNSLTLETRGRGRPLGSKNKRRDAQFQHYNPKRWHPEFNLIVIESIAGKSNEALSEEFGYTPQHISNILSTSHAAQIREGVRTNINKEFDGQLKNRIAAIGEKTLKHIEHFVDDERNLAEKSPFMFLDRVLKISQATATLDSDSKHVSNNLTINGNAAFVMSKEQSDGIRNALLDSSSLESISIDDNRIKDRDIEERPRLKVMANS